MASAIIDSCCLIDLLASGHAEPILGASGHAWHLPVAVQGEVQFVRQRDPNDSSKIISVPVDLSPLFSAGMLVLCRPEVPAELDLYIQYAARFGSDGEAMCLALAEHRGWHLATDDKEVMRIGQQAGLQIVSTPELLKAWSVKAAPDAATVARALTDIELYARFRPNPAMAESPWWWEQTTS